MAIRAIMVGCGNFARGRLEALLKTGRYEVVALVDQLLEMTDAALERYKEHFGSHPPTCFRSLHEALAHVEADACFIIAASTFHAPLAALSLAHNLHTMVIKPLALTVDSGKAVLREAMARPHLILAVGQNKRWNPASQYMQRLLQDSDEIGEILGGECRFWIRQDLRLRDRRIQPDGTQRGEFFLAGASHQIDQMVAALGLPHAVTARCDRRLFLPELGQAGVHGTAGGQALFDYGSFTVSYTGTRAAHSNQAGWSGVWSFRGTRGDFTRNGGHFELFRQGERVHTEDLQDLHPGLIEDDRLQYEAFANAIEGDDHARAYLENTVDSWILAIGCNLSEIQRQTINLHALREEVWG